MCCYNFLSFVVLIPFDNTPNADHGLDAKHPVSLDKTLTAGQTLDVTVGFF
jgi:hypothetical protein